MVSLVRRLRLPRLRAPDLLVMEARRLRLDRPFFFLVGKGGC